ncbi:MAG: hypothetical protein IT258_10390 [Saprospiraceae bacterium]|nr:hypothetical protein [Saprospiraceae bacterium]
MKATTISILAIFLGLSLNLNAQTTAIWQGGKSGRTTDWNCPANWSEGRVPDEFTQVVIPAGANSYPVIHYAPAPIDALLMEAGARLTITDGARLAILGETGIFDGITIFGQIENNGTLEIGEALNRGVAFLKQVQGNGIIVSPSAGTDTLARRR